MSAVLPYTYEPIVLEDFAPILGAYPELSESIQNILDEKFVFDGNDSWDVNFPEMEFEATFESNSVSVNFADEWEFVTNWDDGELNLEWTGPGQIIPDCHLLVDNCESVSQNIALTYDIIDLSANLEAVTSLSGDSMTDEVALSGGLDDGIPSISFEWNHSGDLFDIATQSYALELEASAEGDCDFSSTGRCNAQAVLTTLYTNDNDNINDSNTHTATFVSKPRIAWATYQINDNSHYVVGFRAEDEDGKSAAFEDMGYVSVWFKEFSSTTRTPGRVANSRLGKNVVTLPLADALENQVFPALAEALEPFDSLFSNIAEYPEAIPHLAVYFDLWCEEALPDELGLAEVVAASRISVWGVSNEMIQEYAEDIDSGLMHATFKNEVIPEFYEEARNYVQELFGQQGLDIFEQVYLD